MDHQRWAENSWGEQRKMMQCNLITYLLSSSAHGRELMLGIQEYGAFYNVIAVNLHRRKPHHRPRLLHPAWRLQGHPAGPFVLQAVVLE